jgi:hypothetical protein
VPITRIFGRVLRWALTCLCVACEKKSSDVHNGCFACERLMGADVANVPGENKGQG